MSTNDFLEMTHLYLFCNRFNTVTATQGCSLINMISYAGGLYFVMRNTFKFHIEVTEKILGIFSTIGLLSVNI